MEPGFWSESPFWRMNLLCMFVLYFCTKKTFCYTVFSSFLGNLHWCHFAKGSVGIFMSEVSQVMRDRYQRKKNITLFTLEHSRVNETEGCSEAPLWLNCTGGRCHRNWRVCLACPCSPCISICCTSSSGALSTGSGSRVH